MAGQLNTPLLWRKHYNWRKRPLAPCLPSIGGVGVLRLMFEVLLESFCQETLNLKLNTLNFL